MTAADDYNASRLLTNAITVQHITELVRYWQAGHSLAVDGMAGPDTIASIDAARRPAPFLSCPLPVLADGRRATITSSFRPKDRPDHDGVDWFYQWRAGDQPDRSGDKLAAGSAPDGRPKWVVPYGVHAIAAAGGIVQLAGSSPTGYRVWIDHGNGLRSGYFHLMGIIVHEGQSVSSGAALGLVGDNPADNDARHLHFEVSPVARYSPLDPEMFLIREPRPPAA